MRNTPKRASGNPLNPADKSRSAKTPNKKQTPSATPPAKSGVRPRATSSKGKAGTPPSTPSPSKATPKAATPVSGFAYDVAVSFAGENRAFAADVVKSLKRRRIRCFYDLDEQASLWGKDLYTHLDEVYRKLARFCIMFVSKHYLVKLWPKHERQSIQARMFESSDDYLLPVRLDDTEIPGLRSTLGYIDGRHHTPSEVAAMVQAKMQGKNVRIKASKAAVSEVKRVRKTTADGTTPATGVRRKVTGSGKWILLGDHFYDDALVVKEKDAVKVQIAPKTSRQEGELKALESRPHWKRSGLAFAYGNDAMKCQVHDVSSRFENGKSIYTLTLQPENASSNRWEMAVQNLSADQIADKRARLVLLHEKPATGNAFQDSHILQGSGSDSYEAGIISKVLKKQEGAVSQQSLQKARLAAIYQLTASGIIEHVLELTLGPVTKAGIAVDFEGRRQPYYDNKAASIIRVAGHVPVPEKK